MGADSIKFGAQNVLFGMPVAPNLAPRGPSSDARGLGSTRKETLGVQAWISIDFGRTSGPPFGRFWITLAQQLSFFDMRVYRSRFLKILAFESRCLRLQNQVFGVEGIAKISFSHMSGLCRCW